MQRIGIVGLGLIGGSIAKRLLERGGRPLGWDERAGVREQAARLGVRICGPERIAGEADLAVVATPPEAIAAQVELLLRSGAAAVTDTGSVKGELVAALAGRLEPELLRRYLAAHPLGGSQLAGLRNARADLLDGCVWAACGPAPEPATLLALGELVELFGARIVACEPDRHDLAVARSSHLIRLVQIALAAGLADEPPLVHLLSGPALRESTRLAESSWDLWEEIFTSNRGELDPALARFRSELASVADHERLPHIWRHAELGRERLISSRWRQPSWRQGSVPLGSFWRRLVELGEAGVAIRRPRLEPALLCFERAA